MASAPVPTSVYVQVDNVAHHRQVDAQMAVQLDRDTECQRQLALEHGWRRYVLAEVTDEMVERAARGLARPLLDDEDRCDMGYSSNPFYDDVNPERLLRYARAALKAAFSTEADHG